MNNYNWRQIDIRYYAIAASLLISIFTMLFPDTPNDDAFVYIRTAEIFQTEGIGAAFNHYPWATFSILIATVANITGVELFTAAYVINALFFALLTYSFIGVAREIEDTDTFLLLAALTVLLYPQLNEYRYSIVRDTGFWALAVFALWQFLLFSRYRMFTNAIAYSLALVFAATLRVEALLYLITIPLALIFDPRFPTNRSRYDFFKLQGFNTLLLLILTATLSLLKVNLFSQVAEFMATYIPFFAALFNPDEIESIVLANAMFNEHAATYSHSYVTLFMLAGFVIILFIKLLDGIGIPLLLILGLGCFKRILHMPKPVFLPVLAYLLLNSLILLIFVYVTQFLTSRYTILVCLLLSLFVPIVLLRFLQWGRDTARVQLTRGLTALFFLYCTVDVFVGFGVDKYYIEESVDWLSDNAPASATLLTNNHSIAYYSDRVENYDQTKRIVSAEEIIAAQPGSYLALELFYEMEQLLATDKISMLVEFQSGFPDSSEHVIAIYKKAD